MDAGYVLEYDVLSSEEEHDVYLLARIKGQQPEGMVQRPPLNLSVVLDRSGSMRGAKLSYVKQATSFLVQHLGAEDTLSIVSYDDTVQVERQPGPVALKDPIRAAIERIKVGGSTNLSGGWLQGCQLVSEYQAEAQVNRVLLLTDGLANRGITDPDRLTSMARQKREEGVTTTTLGVGMDFNEDLLTRMAAEGGGAFYFIDDPDQAPQIFSEELQDLLNVVGQNLVITLSTGEDVRLVRQLNDYPMTTVRNEITFRLGDLYADEIKALMLELHIPALQALGEVEVATLRFDYDEMGQDTVTHRTIELPIVVNAVVDSEAAQIDANIEVKKSALLLEAANAREEAVKHADTGNFKKASESLTLVADAIEQAGIEDQQLQDEHNRLREEAIDMELGAERYDSYTRKTFTSQSYTRTHTTRRYAAQTAAVHGRKKASREAIERGKPTPTQIRWDRKETLDLEGRDEVTIGRAASNDIVLSSDEVSAEHCIIQREGDELYLEDLGSSNGTYANGGVVHDRFRLSVGDVVTVGRTLFRFE